MTKLQLQTRVSTVYEQIVALLGAGKVRSLAETSFKGVLNRQAEDSPPCPPALARRGDELGQ